MLRIRPRYRLQVPHGLAVVGALLLLASTVTGVGSALNTRQAENTALPALVSSSEMESAESASNSVDTVPQAPVKQKKRFKVNLFLFRR